MRYLTNPLYKAIFIAALIYSAVTNAEVPVIDAASLQQQIQNYIREGLILEQLVEQTKAQLQQLKALSGGQYQWSNAQTLLNKLGDDINKAGGLAYSSQDINARYQKLFPGYQAPTDYQQHYQDWIKITQATLSGTLQAMSTSSQTFQNENTRLAFLQAQGQSAQGQMQAIQIGLQLASETISQLQLLRQTQMAQASAQTTYYSAQIQNEASREAELHKILKAGDTEVRAYGTSGDNFNTVPTFR